MVVFVLCWPGFGTGQGLGRVLWLRPKVGVEELEKGQANTEGTNSFPLGRDSGWGDGSVDRVQALGYEFDP